MAWLIHVDTGPHQGEQYLFRSDNIINNNSSITTSNAPHTSPASLYIGRNPRNKQNDLQIQLFRLPLDKEISGHHITLSLWKDGRLTIQDNHSTNGTKIQRNVSSSTDKQLNSHHHEEEVSDNASLTVIRPDRSVLISDGSIIHIGLSQLRLIYTDIISMSTTTTTVPVPTVASASISSTSVLQKRSMEIMDDQPIEIELEDDENKGSSTLFPLPKLPKREKPSITSLLDSITASTTTTTKFNFKSSSSTVKQSVPLFDDLPYRSIRSLLLPYFANTEDAIAQKSISFLSHNTKETVNNNQDDTEDENDNEQYQHRQQFLSWFIIQPDKLETKTNNHTVKFQVPDTSNDSNTVSSVCNTCSLPRILQDVWNNFHKETSIITDNPTDLLEKFSMYIQEYIKTNPKLRNNDVIPNAKEISTNVIQDTYLNYYSSTSTKQIHNPSSSSTKEIIVDMYSSDSNTDDIEIMESIKPNIAIASKENIIPPSQTNLPISKDIPLPKLKYRKEFLQANVQLLVSPSRSLSSCIGDSQPDPVIREQLQQYISSTESRLWKVASSPSRLREANDTVWRNTVVPDSDKPTTLVSTSPLKQEPEILPKEETNIQNENIIIHAIEKEMDNNNGDNGLTNPELIEISPSIVPKKNSDLTTPELENKLKRWGLRGMPRDKMEEQLELLESQYTPPTEDIKYTMKSPTEFLQQQTPSSAMNNNSNNKYSSTLSTGNQNSPISSSSLYQIRESLALLIRHNRELRYRILMYQSIPLSDILTLAYSGGLNEKDKHDIIEAAKLLGIRLLSDSNDSSIE